MVWHFVFVILDTFLNKYSYGAELLSYIKDFEKLNYNQRPDIKIDLFWDCEEFLNNSVQVHYDKNKVEYIRKEKNIFHKLKKIYKKYYKYIVQNVFPYLVFSFLTKILDEGANILLNLSLSKKIKVTSVLKLNCNYLLKR